MLPLQTLIRLLTIPRTVKSKSNLIKLIKRHAAANKKYKKSRTTIQRGGGRMPSKVSGTGSSSSQPKRHLARFTKITKSKQYKKFRKTKK